MYFQCLFLFFLSRLSQACDPKVDPFHFYVHSVVKGTGLGSECDPFHDTDSALSTALRFPNAKLILIASAATIENSYMIESGLEIDGMGVSLYVRKMIEVRKKGILSIINLKLSADEGLEGSVILLSGTLNIEEVDMIGTTTGLVEVQSGALYISSSSFSNFTASLLTITGDGSSIDFSLCSFDTFANDLIQAYSSMHFTMTNCLIFGISGQIFNFANESDWNSDIFVTSSNIGNSLGGFIGGTANRVSVVVANSTFQSMREISHGFLTLSNLTFDCCIFDTFSDSLFALDSLSGSIDISNSEISNVHDGAVIFIPNNPYSSSESVISVTSCLLFNLTNLSPAPSSALIFGQSATLTVSDTEIHHVTALALINIADSELSISDSLYRDSSVSVFPLMTASSCTVIITNFTMVRVENDEFARIAYLADSDGYWDGVRIEDSTAANGQQGDCSVLILSKSSFTVRNSRFSLKQFGHNRLTVTDGELNVTNMTLTDVTYRSIVYGSGDSSIKLTGISMDNVTAIAFLNCYGPTVAATLSDIHTTPNITFEAFLYLYSSEVHMSDIVFDGITALSLLWSSGDVVDLQRIEVKNCDLKICRFCSITSVVIEDFRFENSYGYRMLYMEGANVTLRNGVIENIVAENLFEVLWSNFTIDHVKFANCSVEAYGGLITVWDGSTLTLLNSEFSHLLGVPSYRYGLIRIDGSVLNITGSGFDVFNTTLVYAFNSSILITRSNLRDGGLVNPNKSHAEMAGGVIYAKDSVDVQIDKSVFERIISDYGGIAYLIGRSDGGSIFTFSGNEVHSCSALIAGGGIYGDSVSFDISHSLFTRNNAKFGGTIYLQSSLDESKLTVFDSQFRNNTAHLDGGAISLSHASMKTSNSSYIGNTAVYGHDFASLFTRVVLLDANNRPIPNATFEAASGQTVNQTLVFGLVDDLNQVVASDESTPLVLSSNDTLEGLLLWYPVSGKYFVTNLAIVAQPLSTVQLLGSTPNSTDVLATFHMRECKVGESFEDLRCTVCTNNMYSLTPSSPCKLCPAEATCSDGYHMELQPGYWRSSVISDDFYECLATEMCNGGFESVCIDGHNGPLCAKCDDSFFKSTQLQCLSCGGFAVSLMKDVLALVISMSGIVSTAVAGSETAQSLVLVGLDYFSLLRIFSNMNVIWPSPLAYFFAVLGDIGSVGLTGFSDLCLGGLSNLEPMYSQLMISITYFFSVALSITLCGLIMLYTQCVSGRTVLSVLATVCYAMIPLLFMRAIELFSCIRVEGVQRLVFNSSEECWTAQHLKFAIGFALPILIISVLLASLLFAVAMLRSNRCFGGLAKWKCFYLSVFLFRSYVLSLILVMSNALVLEVQVAVTLLVTLVTELILKIERSQQAKLISTTYRFAITAAMSLSFVLILYDSATRSESGRKAVILVLISFGVIAASIISAIIFAVRIRRKIPPMNYAVRVDESYQSSSCLAFVPPPSFNFESELKT